MKDENKIFQHSFRMKGTLLMKDEFCRVTTIYVVFTIGLKKSVGLMHRCKVMEGYARSAIIVADKPEVGSLSTAEHTLE
jgi:hypothetical protein